MIPSQLSDQTVLLLSDDNIGMGTAILDLDILVCIEKTVRNCTEIKFESKHQKGITEILYSDEVNNIAFCKLPENMKGISFCKEDNSFFDLNEINSAFKIQGEPIIHNEVLHGLIAYPVIQSDTIRIIFKDTIINAYHEWKKSEISPAIKCPSCNSINKNYNSILYCNKCQNQITYQEPEPEISLIYTRIENIIAAAGFPPEYSRRGSGIWCLRKDNLSLELTYHQRTGCLLAQIKIGVINSFNKNEVLNYLLKQNFHNKEMVLSVKNEIVYLLLTLFDDYLDDLATKNSLIKMLKFGRNYQEVLNTLCK